MDLIVFSATIVFICCFLVMFGHGIKLLFDFYEVGDTYSVVLTVMIEVLILIMIIACMVFARMITQQ